jgi:hypothetical protein
VGISLHSIRLHSYRNCPLVVWRFSQTRQYHICHRSGRLGDRVDSTLDFKLYHHLKLLDIPVGLLINFHEPLLKNGISRMILPGANRTEETNEVSLYEKDEQKKTKKVGLRAQIRIFASFVTFCKRN